MDLKMNIGKGWMRMYVSVRAVVQVSTRRVRPPHVGGGVGGGDVNVVNSVVKPDIVIHPTPTPGGTPTRADRHSHSLIQTIHRERREPQPNRCLDL